MKEIISILLNPRFITFIAITTLPLIYGIIATVVLLIKQRIEHK